MTPEMHSLYKTIGDKCLFVALDRPDILRRKLSRSVNRPIAGDFAHVKCARQIAGTTKVQLEMHPSRDDKYGSAGVDAYSDTDWANQNPRIGSGGPETC